ncbi:MAG: SCP2 sterol-binding domain-containing protein [Lachnospiraceae bacterium]|nr:SCP2 sterol-binding domain-containing protein [Lachnospiraceae bacterium]
MDYYEIVDKVREGLENADAREVFEHVAVQVNILGEGEGSFYVEIAARQVCVEPYDYYDRDGLIEGDAKTLIAIADTSMDATEALKKGLIRIEGNKDKLKLLYKVRIKKPLKK